MAKDIYHNMVKTALEKDEWIITSELFRFSIGSRSVYIDLIAEKLLVAEKEGRKIAVEIKSFLSPSPVKDERKCARTIYTLSGHLRTFRTRTSSLSSH